MPSHPPLCPPPQWGLRASPKIYTRTPDSIPDLYPRQGLYRSSDNCRGLWATAHSGTRTATPNDDPETRLRSRPGRADARPWTALRIAVIPGWAGITGQALPLGSQRDPPVAWGGGVKGSGGRDSMTLQAGLSSATRVTVGIDTIPEKIVAMARPAIIVFMKPAPPQVEYECPT
jgi:hypothetical protein